MGSSKMDNPEKLTAYPGYTRRRKTKHKTIWVGTTIRNQAQVT